MLYDENYLAHYGILGMRWGVRRSPEELRRISGKLTEENSSKYDTIVKEKERAAKNLPRVQQLRSKAARVRAKEFNFLTTKKGAEKLEYQARKMESKASVLESKYLTGGARAEKYKSQILKNQELISTFNNTADAIENGKILAGNKFFMKYEKASVDDLLKDR